MSQTRVSTAPLPRLDELETPRVVVDLDRLEANLARQQAICDEHQVELWPHIKTHKCVEIARRQLELGARGLTCAKIGEAEAMLPSGVRRIFIAHSIVDPRNGPRLAALAGALDELIMAVTSKLHAEALNAVLASAGLTLPVMMAVDTGLGREGSRSLEDAKELAATIQCLSNLTLRGFYSHEGHAYGKNGEELETVARAVHAQLSKVRDAIAPELPIWPGCSATAAIMATLPNVQAVRPGAYVYGDISLCVTAKVLPWEAAALTILTTVVDRPQPGLALIDAGSKTFSGDKARSGDSGIELREGKLRVIRCNEEHGYLNGDGVDDLNLGDRLRFIPAHVCPVLNLADETIVVRGAEVVDIWPVDARGKNR
ncbi:MAG TPA: alanine racemase [Chthoniobacteraceae bacterium]|nr:alanine racemase [Chthoniobacteraceae bacterium]